MSDEFLYLAVVKRWADASRGAASFLPTHSHYALKFDRAITHERMSDIATRLVAAERLLTKSSVRFGRVVFLQVSEEHGFDFNTRTGTSLPSSSRMTTNPEQLTGLRTEYMAHDAATVTLCRDRRKGRRWKKDFHGALSLSECVPAFRPRGEPVSWGLDLSGPTVAWCAPWAAWALSNIPEFTTQIEISPEGVAERFAEDAGPIQVAYATDQAKLRAWSLRVPAPVAALWQIERDNDRNITLMLRTYRDKMLAFNHSWYDGNAPDFDAMLTAIHNAAQVWTKYAALLGYNVPPYAPGSYEAQAVSSGSSAALRGTLQLKRHSAEVFKCVNFLYLTWNWLRRQFRAPGIPAKPLWLFWYFPKPNWQPDTHGDPWFDTQKYPAATGGRSGALWRYDHYPEMLAAMWGTMHAINVLEQLVVPANKRALERTAPGAPTIMPSKRGTIPRRVPSVWEFEPYLSMGEYPRDPILSFQPEPTIPPAPPPPPPTPPRRQWKWDFSTDAERRGTTDYDASTPEPWQYGGEPGQGPKEALWRKADAVADAWVPESRRKEWDANSAAAEELARFGDGYDTPNMSQT